MDTGGGWALGPCGEVHGNEEAWVAGCRCYASWEGEGHREQKQGEISLQEHEGWALGLLTFVSLNQMENLACSDSQISDFQSLHLQNGVEDNHRVVVRVKSYNGRVSQRGRHVEEPS